MKRFPAFAFIAVTCLAGIGSALAQENTIQATIPFDFNIRNQVLPPGAYRITSLSRNIVQISNLEKTISVLSLSMDGDRPSGRGGKLVFNKYGNQYFLSEIVNPGALKSLELPTSKLEKKVRWQQGRIHTDDQTLVALK